MRSGKFKLKSDFKPAGDQPKAISGLVEGLKKGLQKETLLGVTGSGKTFTIANVIEAVQKPTLVIAHNKTLAAQLAQEYKEFFPENAVHYFVSYYDYYQPEAYIATTDTYIEKEAQINEEIERLRHASTQALLTRKDVIIVASVSCIYGLGSPIEYEKVNLRIEKGSAVSRLELIRRLIAIHYERVPGDLSPGTFRALGNMVELMPVSERFVYRISLAGNSISGIAKLDAITREVLEQDIPVIFLFPAKHFITEPDAMKRALKSIDAELKSRLAEFEKEGKILEAERLRRRTSYDLALIREIGYCNGIENYSRHFSGRLPGEAPDTLLSYFPKKKKTITNSLGQTEEVEGPDFLTVIDESHVTVPQLSGMYAGDASRKKNLVEHGFRLPSACDNRPLTFAEFSTRVGETIFTSATPGPYEFKESELVVEQVIRPTGLIDPEIEVRPIIEGKTSDASTGSSSNRYKGQVFDFIEEAEKVIKKNQRVIATTLTKKMAEDLSAFLKEKGLKAEYLHSDIETLDRIMILTEFRKGKFDCLVGVNLLREGLDLPEVSLIGILDADKEGFLRSETSLIQTIGRAARNVEGRVILYADNVTGSMKRAMGETSRRRSLQMAYNKVHGITPKTIVKKIHDITEAMQTEHKKTVATLLALDQKALEKNPERLIREKEKQMNAAVKVLDFESAAILRDEILEIKKYLENPKVDRPKN